MSVMGDEAVQPFQRIVLDVRKKITAGQITVGEKLPSTRELADEYGVAAGTVQRALSELRTAGVIYSHQGRGSYVADRAAGEAGRRCSPRMTLVLADRPSRSPFVSASPRL
jgi:DNA-binding GntR family transcriptional regulator